MLVVESAMKSAFSAFAIAYLLLELGFRLRHEPSDLRFVIQIVYSSMLAVAFWGFL